MYSEELSEGDKESEAEQETPKLFGKEEIQQMNGTPTKINQQSMDERADNVVPNLAVEDESDTHTYVPNELLAEYNSTLENMKSEIIAYQKEQEGLSNEVCRLVEENRRLSSELRDASSVQEKRIEESMIIRNLQEQLKIAEEARDSAIHMWQSAVEEVSRYEKLAQENHGENDLNTLEVKLSQMQEEYVRAVCALQGELQEEKEELRKGREQHNLTLQELKDCKKLCSNLEEQLKSKGTGNEALQKKYYDSQAKLLEKEAALTEFQNKLALKEKAELQLRSKVSYLEQVNSDLQKQNADLVERESKFTQQAKESIRLAEDAILQKEEAIFREQQAIKEADRLQLSLNNFVESAAQRTKQEVDNIKKKCNENIKQLMEEMHSLEMDNNEKQAQYDRVLREKQAAEAELESLYNEGLHKGPHSNPLYEDLIKKLNETEQLFNKAKLKAQSLEVELEKTKASQQQESDLFCIEKNILQDRLHQLQEELKETCVKKVKLAEKIEQVQHLVKEKEDNGFLLGKRLNKEIEILKQKIQQQQEEYQVHLRNMDETYQTSISELRKLLDAQKQMSEKWKLEAHSLADKLEKEMREMFKDSSRMQQSNEELSIELEKCQARNIFNEQQVSKCNGKIIQLQKQLKKLQGSGI